MSSLLPPVLVVLRECTAGDGGTDAKGDTRPGDATPRLTLDPPWLPLAPLMPEDRLGRRSVGGGMTRGLTSDALVPPVGPGMCDGAGSASSCARGTTTPCKPFLRPAECADGSIWHLAYEFPVRAEPTVPSRPSAAASSPTLDTPSCVPLSKGLRSAWMHGKSEGSRFSAARAYVYGRT